MSQAETHTELLVMGGGLAGLVAARRARELGLDTVVVAESPGSLPFTSGSLDLLAVYPTETKRHRARPWQALSELIEREPQHPYGRVGLRDVRRALDAVVSQLEAGPLGYHREPEHNLAIITAAGTIKPSYAIAATLRDNAAAWEQRRPTLLVGFDGLPDFAPEQVVGNLRQRWPGLRAARLSLGELLDTPARPSVRLLAAEFEGPAFRDRFVAAVQPHLQGCHFLGLPAVLGFMGATEICAELTQRLDVAVFEIPLLSPSLPGTRLAELLKHELLAAGVPILQGAPLCDVASSGDRLLVAHRAGRWRTEAIRAEAFVLATGRFFGGGLVASQQAVRECLLDLHVPVPFSRDDWHMGTFLGAPGHPINRVGVQVDRSLRPTDGEGAPVYRNLFAAGALLAHHDWVREKSGAGLAIATGYAAAEAAAAYCHGGAT